MTQSLAVAEMKHAIYFRKDEKPLTGFSYKQPFSSGYYYAVSNNIIPSFQLQLSLSHMTASGSGLDLPSEDMFRISAEINKIKAQSLKNLPLRL